MSVSVGIDVKETISPTEATDFPLMVAQRVDDWVGLKSFLGVVLQIGFIEHSNVFFLQHDIHSLVPSFGSWLQKLDK